MRKFQWALFAAVTLWVGTFIGAARATPIVIASGSNVYADGRNYWWGHLNSQDTPIGAPGTFSAAASQCDAYEQFFCNGTNANAVVLSTGDTLSAAWAWDQSSSQGGSGYHGFTTAAGAIHFQSDVPLTAALSGFQNSSGFWSNFSSLSVQLYDNTNSAVLFSFSGYGPSIAAFPDGFLLDAGDYFFSFSALLRPAGFFHYGVFTNGNGAATLDSLRFPPPLPALWRCSASASRAWARPGDVRRSDRDLKTL